MKNIFLLVGLMVLSLPISSQDLDIAGKAIIRTMDLENTTDNIVVRLPDGTLAVRDVSSITEFQIITISNDTIFLSNGGFVKLPALTNEIQQMSVSLIGDSLNLTGGGFVIIPGISAANFTIQEQLDEGVTPKQLYDAGFILDSLYGKTFAGGLIFYVDVNDDHPFEGLVAAPMDLDLSGDFSRPWGCGGMNLPIPNVPFGPSGPGAEIGDGISNTIGIDTAACSVAGDAAVMSAALAFDGFDDWFLPSVKELNEMHKKIGQGAPAPNTNIGGFANVNYWSSTESGNDFAWSESFSTSAPLDLPKVSFNRSRAVRAF